MYKPSSDPAPAGTKLHGSTESISLRDLGSAPLRSPHNRAASLRSAARFGELLSWLEVLAGHLDRASHRNSFWFLSPAVQDTVPGFVSMNQSGRPACRLAALSGRVPINEVVRLQ